MLYVVEIYIVTAIFTIALRNGKYHLSNHRGIKAKIPFFPVDVDLSMFIDWSEIIHIVIS